MRCKTCDYRLWNLPSRQCPECGTPFRPTDYEFVPNSVQFCCPHCHQAYYGTDERGHLEPIEFECTSCSNRIHMDDMILMPTAGLEEEQTQVEQMPWLDRAKRGVIRAWLSCVGMALVAPSRLMKLTPLTSSTASAWWFAIFTSMLILLVYTVPLFVSIWFMGRAFGGPGPGPAFLGGLGMGVAGVFCGVLVGVLAFIALEGLIAHGLLRLTGKTASGLGRTYHAVCYSSGAGVLGAVPCLGGYFGWIWPLVSAVLMLREGQRVHGGRAALAVLTLPCLVISGLFALWLWALVSAMSAGNMSGTPTETRIVLEGILDYAKEHSGGGPDHAIQLVADEYVVSYDLASVDSMTAEKDVPLGNTSLERFDFLSSAEKDQLVQSVVEALPVETIAHRLGDFVFTYHGMDLNTADDRLWVVIQWHDLDSNAYVVPRNVQVYQIPGKPFSIGLADGSLVQHPTSSIDALLAAQNALRTVNGLPALPHPEKVTHASPAVAPPQN